MAVAGLEGEHEVGSWLMIGEQLFTRQLKKDSPPRK
jgi:hypothetical protein